MFEAGRGLVGIGIYDCSVLMSMLDIIGSQRGAGSQRAMRICQCDRVEYGVYSGAFHVHDLRYMLESCASFLRNGEVLLLTLSPVEHIFLFFSLHNSLHVFLTPLSSASFLSLSNKTVSIPLLILSSPHHRGQHQYPSIRLVMKVPWRGPKGDPFGRWAGSIEAG